VEPKPEDFEIFVEKMGSRANREISATIYQPFRNEMEKDNELRRIFNKSKKSIETIVRKTKNLISGGTKFEPEH
jgi:hypothetical protein